MTLIFCLKHTLTLEDDVDVWLAKLVQGGYIPSASDHPYYSYHRGRLLLPIFCVLEFQIASYVLSILVHCCN